VYTPLATTFIALFACNFFQKSTIFPKFIFLLEVSRELPQCLTLNMSLVALSIFVIHLRSFNPVCSYIFSCVAFQPTNFCSVQNLPHFRQFVHSFTLQCLPTFTLLPRDKCPTNLWTFPTISDLANMTREDFTSPVAVAATAQVKLCPYNEEEPHIWFRLIEAQFAAGGIKSQREESNHKNSNMPMPSPACPSKLQLQQPTPQHVRLVLEGSSGTPPPVFTSSVHCYKSCNLEQGPSYYSRIIPALSCSQRISPPSPRGLPSMTRWT
jgi:hypothetical protein